MAALSRWAGLALLLGGTLLLGAVVGTSQPVHRGLTAGEKSAPTRPLVAAPFVVAAIPRHLSIPAIGMDVAIDIDDSAAGSVVQPPLIDRPYWISAYGMPGSDADNTVYLAGHSGYEGRAIFNRLLGDGRQPLDLRGQEVVIQTDAGVLRYLVDAAAIYPKAELPGNADVWEVRPGRLVLVTCGSEDLAYNVVFFASLASVRSLSPPT